MQLLWTGVNVAFFIKKNYERVIVNRLVDNLEKKMLFYEHQHGFRKGQAFTSALLEFTETIIDSIGKGDKVCSR